MSIEMKSGHCHRVLIVEISCQTPKYQPVADIVIFQENEKGQICSKIDITTILFALILTESLQIHAIRLTCLDA